jgi:membrane protein
MSALKNYFNKTYQIGKDTLRYLNEDEPIVYSAAIGFFTIFSLPAILIVISMIASLFFHEEDVRNEIVQHVDSLINNDAGEQVAVVLESVSQMPSGFWGITIGILLIIKSATIILFIIQKALNSIWRVKVKKGANKFRLFMYRLLTFMLIAGLGLAFVGSIVLDMLLIIYADILHAVFEEYFHPAVRSIQYLFGAVIAFISFTIILKALPDAKIPWKDAMAGGLITAILFIIGKQIISMILSSIEIAGVYAAAGSLVIVLLWVFYSAQILFLGAEITKAYNTYHGREVKPSAIAVKWKKQNQEEG